VVPNVIFYLVHATGGLLRDLKLLWSAKFEVWNLRLRHCGQATQSRHLHQRKIQ
jgi:hypothetical protein